MMENYPPNYLNWLMEMVGTQRGEDHYSLLLRALFSRRFKWSVPNDNNRNEDGIMLRSIYCDEKGIVPVSIYFQQEANILEFLIALANRCHHNHDALEPSEWFWIMCENAGFTAFNDEDFYFKFETFALDDVINRIIHRTYARSGRGGLFPLKDYEEDQRKVEIWYQMMGYLNENFVTL